eukprot:CAMPEP_0185758706 /NCGR_PEP_ID=MMETSP1174-20130828/17382_1 /TAXON_ID=35687 /ORGANISM="Dictyocha speculum, Strain CCMP1381" /LENGTH=70 /DNA_ID=CAMNT_0028438681 /DNA_START=292 /DNA_END=504 /DNA_ORIENTATION=+
MTLRVEIAISSYVITLHTSSCGSPCVDSAEALHVVEITKEKIQFQDNTSVHEKIVKVNDGGIAQTNNDDG